MLFKNNIKALSILLLLLILTIGISIRFINLDSHFSHVDDLIAVHHLKSENASSFQKAIDYADEVAKSSTYAPLQFVLTGMLANSNMKYKDVKFWTRLPSLIMTLLSFIIIFYIMKILYKKNFLIYSLPAITLLAFSWEDIIYSMQSESYTIALLSVLIFFYLFFYFIQKDNVSLKLSLGLGIILSFLIFSSYQVVLFLPGFFLAIFLKHRKNYIRYIKNYAITFGLLIVSFYVLYSEYLTNVAGRGLNWNMGPHREFFFNLSPYTTLYESILYTIKFFIYNTFYIFKNLIGYIDEKNIFHDILIGVILFLFLIGIISWFKSSNNMKRFFVYYFLTTSAIWIVLLILHKFALSPTRHSLILLSYILIFVPAGLFYILNKLKLDEQKRHISIIVLIVFFSLSFVFNYQQVISKRSDPVTSEKIKRIIKEYEVSEIYSYGWTWNLSYMQYIKKYFNISNAPQGDKYYKNKNKNYKNNGTILFITHRNRVLKQKIEKRLLQISKRSLDTKMKLIYKSEDISKTEICFGNQTKNGTNSLLIYILKIEKI